jgi:23S rRNA pseudouridine2605 synthase
MKPIMTRKSPKGEKPRNKRPVPPQAAAEAVARPAPRAAERIAKVIARAGLASRREAEGFIAAGRVAVNGAVIPSPALNVGDGDKITVDGKPLPTRERTRLFLYHKPRGLMTTRLDPEGRPTIFGALPKDLPRLISIGRLDFTTEGLLLLTNDGGLARVLELPQTGWLRRYRVRAHGGISQGALDALREGITVDGIRYGPIEATLDRLQGSNVWLTFAIREGKNREIRNVLGALGLAVNRLIRVSFGPFQLGELDEGAVEEVKTRTLSEQIGERLAAQAGADFAAPLLDREGVAAPPQHDDRTKPKPKPAHGARRSDERRNDNRRDKPRPAPKGKLGFAGRADERKAGAHGSHVWRDRRAPPGEAKQAAHLTDRKGRRVVVERARSEEPSHPRGRPRRP